MRRQRLVTGSGLRPAPLRPGASPVSTFVQPEAGRKLSRLAEGLAQFAPSLMQFSETLHERQAQRDKAEGDRLAREWFEAGKTYRQAIDEGLIRPDQSPWFRLGAKEFFGLKAAHTYAADLEEAIRSDPTVSEGTDVATFDEFEREFRARWMSENVGEGRDLAFESAFGKNVDNLVFGIRRNYAVEAGERLQRYTIQEMAGVIMGEVLAIHAGERTPENAARAVRLNVERATAIGTNRRVANRTAVAAVINAARSVKDVTLLRTLDHILADGDSGPRLSHVYAAEVKEAEDAILSQHRTEAQFANWQYEVERKERAGEIKQEALRRLVDAENPADVDIDDLVREVDAILPGAGLQLYQMRDAMIQNRHYNDEAVAEDLMEGIWRGEVGITEISSALDRGDLNRQGFNDLVNNWLRYQSHLTSTGDGTKRNMAYDDPEYKNKMRTFPGLFASEFDWTHASATRRDRAVAWMNRAWSIYWHEGGGSEATFQEKQRFLDELTETIRRSLSGSPEDADDVPASPLPGPKRPIWQVKRVVDPPILEDLKVRIKKARPPTPDQYEILTKLGIDPLNRVEVEQFIAAQMQFPVDR